MHLQVVRDSQRIDDSKLCSRVKDEACQLLNVLLDLHNEFGEPEMSEGEVHRGEAIMKNESFGSALRGLVPVLLASFGASLSPADRSLFRLLRSIESSLSNYAEGGLLTCATEFGDSTLSPPPLGMYTYAPAFLCILLQPRANMGAHTHARTHTDMGLPA